MIQLVNLSLEDEASRTEQSDMMATIQLWLMK